jgi:hypothetical protein
MKYAGVPKQEFRNRDPLKLTAYLSQILKTVTNADKKQVILYYLLKL